MREADNAYSIQFLITAYIITEDFVALSLFTGYVVFIITSSLASAESGYQRLLSCKVLSCLSGVMLSIRSPLLFSYVMWIKSDTARYFFS